MKFNKNLFTNENKTKVIGLLTILIFMWLVLYFIPEVFVSLFNTLLGNLILIVTVILVYMYNKIYILNNRNNFIPANILLSSLDLLRRIIQLLFSFLFFDEQFDTYVVLSLLFFAVSSFMLLYQYFRDNRIIRHVELEDVEIK